MTGEWWARVGGGMTALARWRPGKLARHGGSLFCWMLLRAAMQAGTVVLLARQLGAERYGKFVAVVAVALFLSPFVGFGLSHLVLRNAARDPANEPRYLARALRCWHRTLLPCTAIAMALAWLLLPAGLPLAATGTVILMELAATTLTELCARHRQAQQRIHALGAINAGLAGIRLLGLGLLFLMVSEASINAVLWVYAASSLIYLLALWTYLPKANLTSDAPLPEPMAAKDGLPFSLAGFAMKLQSEFNKPILAQDGFGLAGTYNVAQRAVDMASLPLLALQEALWPRLFAQQNPLRQLRSAGLALLAVALALGTGMWLAAPLLPYVLGESFADAVNVLRWLAWLPVLQVVRNLLNFMVVHRADMKFIGWVYAMGAAISVSSVIILVPMRGTEGAVIACYLSEVAMVTCLWLRSKWLIR